MSENFQKIMNGEVLVLDDIINKVNQDTIESIILNPLSNIGFSYYRNTAAPNQYANSDRVFYDENTLETHQFVSMFVDNNMILSNYWHILSPIQFNVSDTLNKRLVVNRCKININVNDKKFQKNNYYPPHLDGKNNNDIIGLYYVNDCDGDTFFFEKKKITKQVSPKKGRIALWRNNKFHCGQPPFENDCRVVINFLFSLGE